MVYYNDEMPNIKRHRILFAISIILMMLLRHNGKFVVYITGFVVCLRQIMQCRKGFKKNCKLLMLWFFPIVITIIILSAINNIYDVKEVKGEQIRESFSVLFQQTARDIKENGEDITDEETD